MELKLPLEPGWMPMAVSFAETAARGSGLAVKESGLLAVSVEELFLALCATTPGAEISLHFRDRRYAVDFAFRFPRAPPDLRVFNLTARADHETAEGIASMGLFLASRACERFDIHPLTGGAWEVCLRKERAYPPMAPAPDVPSRGPDGWRILDPPPPDGVKQLSALIQVHYVASQFPEEFTPAGRLLDKLASGDYGVVLAQGDRGDLAGGLVWRITEGRVVECFGPYLTGVADPDGLAEALCNDVTARFGRSHYPGMVLYAPGAVPAATGFEPAGTLETPSGRLWTGYRMMAEEFGAVALVPEGLTGFYREWCGRMALAREVRATRDDGEGGDGLTLFGTRVDRAVGMARLTPMLVGRDAASVLAAHLALLDGEGIAAISCVLDTAHPFAALLAPHLLASGFVPRILVPWGGEGDQIHLHLLRRPP